MFVALQREIIFFYVECISITHFSDTDPWMFRIKQFEPREKLDFLHLPLDDLTRVNFEFVCSNPGVQITTFISKVSWT